AWLAEQGPTGTVINTIGLTADFRERPFAAVDAHVTLVAQILRRPGLEGLLLLSSTRVYGRSADSREGTPLPCLSSDPSDLYNLSKLLGESLVLQDPRPRLKVVRLSNVVGEAQPASTFLGALLAEARATGAVRIQQPANTCKDYVALADVLRLLPRIAEAGEQRLYNLGSGVNTSHAEVAALLRARGLAVSFAGSAEPAGPLSPEVPALSIERLALEFTPPARGPWNWPGPHDLES
ncbi:MAG: NAD-dependent epimerase/dehydratase family protein, partial [Prochlorococcaceae cyanobacterium]